MGQHEQSDARVDALQRENEVLRAELAALRRQHAEQAAADPRERAIARLLGDRRVLDSFPDVVSVMDREGRMLYLNRTVEELELEAVRGQKALDYLSEEHRPLFAAAFERAWQTGERERLGIHTTTGHDWQTQLIPIHDAGQVVLMLCTSVDITQQKKIERALRESESQLRHAIEASGMGTWTWSAQRQAARMDATWCRIFGVAPERVPQSRAQYLELVHPEDRSLVAARLGQITSQRRTGEIEHRIVWPSGEVRYVSMHGTPVFDDTGALTGFRGSVFDTTERRRLEEQVRQAQKMEAIGQLTAGIAHNFNNLLAVIMPNVALCRRDGCVKAVGRLDDMEHACRRAAEMVRQLMLFARSGDGSKKSAIDLGDSVRRTLDICRTTFDRKIELALQVAPGVPPVLGNAGELEQVVLNVCLNARDVLEEARVEQPRIEVQLQPCGADRVRLSIADNGPGMSEGVRSRIFEPFFTTKAVGRGTGLGLASAYAIVAEHGGRIACESQPGHGTRFEIELPVASGLREAAAAAASEAAPVRGGHERVLLVDDEPAVRRVLAALLENAGYRVEHASDGVQALERLRDPSVAVDVALIDRSMPRMSGEQLVAKLVELRPALPMVLLSGDPGELTPRGRLRAVLPKPIDERTLLAAVRHALDAPSD